MGNQVEGLEDEPHGLEAKTGQPVAAQRMQGVAIHRCLARRGSLEAPKKMKQSGLAAPRAAHHRQRLAGAELQADAVEGIHDGTADAVAPRQVTNLDQRILTHGQASCRSR